MKNLLILLAGAVIGAGIMYVGLMPKVPTATSSAMGPSEYNCELSGGTFENGSCTCLVEEGQTRAEKYDERTGFCQSDIGGPAGDAFQASVGLPYGDFGFYQNIILDLCEGSGGSMTSSACVCRSGEVYDKSTGRCD